MKSESKQRTLATMTGFERYTKKTRRAAVATAANVSDVAILPDLLHGEETRVWGDGAYQQQTR